MSFRYLTTVAVVASVAMAKTDLTGCTSSDSVFTPANGGTPYATRVYYVPDTGEICAALDCGGGRAPPKTTVPGCAAYQGTETYSPSFLPLKTDSPAASTGASSQAALTTSAPSVTVTPSVSASSKAVESESNKSVDSLIKVESSGTLLTVASSVLESATGFSNGTAAATAASKTGSSARTSTHASGSGATAGASGVPNAAAPVGASKMVGLVAGVVMGVAAWL